jgi:4'-phosphopantetheinyl transferase
MKTMLNAIQLFWPPAAIEDLKADQVAVWCACLDQPPLVREELLCILSFDEKTRADRYCFVRDRDRFIVSRGILRTILGGYLGVEPARMDFCFSAEKPALRECYGGTEILFNLSHSGGVGLFAFARYVQVGIDV